MSEAVQQLEGPIIFGGPLQIEIIDELSFDGVVPGSESKREVFQEFISVMLLEPPWSMPEGEVVFDDDGPRFHYYSAEWWVEPPPPTWAERYRLVPRKRGYWDFWAAEEAAEYLTVAWKRQFGNLGRLVPVVASPATVVAPVAAMPSVIEPVRTERPAIWDESRMAEALGLTETAFIERLESGYWAYKYSNRIETWDESKRPLKVVKYRYTFSEAVRAQNLKNKDKRRKIVMEEGD